MQTLRSKCARLGAIGAATLVSVAGLSVISGVISALPANAGTTPVPTQQNFTYAGPTGFGQQQLAGAASSPTNASQGSNFAISIPGGSQSVPTSQSGVAVNYIDNTNQYYEIPSGSTFVSAVPSGNLSWTGGLNPSLPPSGSAPITVIDCTSAAVSGCDASNNTPLSTTGGAYSGFAGPNPTFPYLLVSTGSTQIPAGATLTTPGVAVNLTASGVVGTVLNWAEFEFKTAANITLFGSSVTATILGWPSAGAYLPAGPFTVATTGATAGTYSYEISGLQGAGGTTPGAPYAAYTAAYNATPAAIQTALSNGTDGPAGTTVTGTSPGTLTVTIPGGAQLTVDFTSLTGGTQTVTAAGGCDGKAPSQGTAPVASPGCPTQTTLPLTSSLLYGTPPVLTSTTISAPAPFINATNTPPINSTATGVTINVSGANWPASETAGTSLKWSGCPTGATCSDTGTFTTSAAGALTGTILFGPNEQLTTSQNPITLTLTASDGTHTATTTVTVNPYQAFAQTCSIGSAPNATCTVNQTISATVIGTSLTISEVQTAPNGSNSAVTLSPVTLGITGATGCPAVPNTACNNQQFAQAQGLLNAVVVSDDRGTLSGWDVTGQLGGDFLNATPKGPGVDNVIPADFLTWQPGVTLETPGSLPANNANTPGCPDQTPPPPSIPIVCTGPSGTPSGNGTAGADPVNGTGVGVTNATAPAEVTAGSPAVLNNPAGTAKELCGTNKNPGGGGGFVCSAGLSLAVPPYVAAGTYSATLNLVVIGY